MKKRVLAFFCLLLLLTPAFAVEPSGADVQVSPKPVPVESAQETKQASSTDNKIVYKQPVSKRKIAMKFIYAMCGVAVSSILLFVLLSLYNKIRSRVVQPPSFDYTNTLTSPNNLKDAVNIFLEKTK